MKKTHPIKNLIAQGEHQQLDFKFEISDAAKIARSLVAFANTDGGKLLIGVKDNGVIAGVRSEEEKFMLENAAKRYCQPEVSFTAKAWVVDGKQVLEVDIPVSPAAPHRAPDHNGNYKAFIRVHDQNLLANGVLMKVWKKRRPGLNVRFVYSQPEQRLLGSLNDNGRITLSETRKITGLSKFKAEQLLSDLIILGVLEMRTTESETIFVRTEPAE
ncbi:MAG: ATP-binding protein [Bacteroidales bacterium]|nr:ATP-binding protein [Bacteroidales bacterium]